MGYTQRLLKILHGDDITPKNRLEEAVKYAVTNLGGGGSGGGNASATDDYTIHGTLTEQVNSEDPNAEPEMSITITESFADIQAARSAGKTLRLEATNGTLVFCFALTAVYMVSNTPVAFFFVGSVDIHGDDEPAAPVLCQVAINSDGAAVEQIHLAVAE